MDNVLLVIVSIFMLFLCLLCLFAVMVIVRDIVRESKNGRKGKDKDENENKNEAMDEMPIPEAPISEETVVNDEPMVDTDISVEPLSDVVEDSNDLPDGVELIELPEEKEDPSAVSFNRVNLTCEEKYSMLSAENKVFFDDIARHALSKDGVKELRKTGYYDYKIGAYRVLRMSIKRGEVVCQFTPIDSDFNSYADESAVKIKQSATTVRVTEPAAVGVVKNGIDLVFKQIEEDKERKKALALEKRRERRRKAKEASEEVPTDDDKE